MPGTPFREVLTLSDAVELIGRRLYSDTWTGLEHASQPSKSPEEIASERKPLETELCSAASESREIAAAILKTTHEDENRRLAARRDELETNVRQLHAKLSLDHPLNDIVVEAYNTHLRWTTARETLMQAIRDRRLVVHDGRGRKLHDLAWSDPRFRYCLDLSFVMNPRSSGEPRRQAARIDREHFNNWLATLPHIVEPLHEPSPEECLAEFLRQRVVAANGGPHKTKDELRTEAVAQIGNATGRMFDRVWRNVVPDEWRESGAPRKAHRSR